MKTWIVWVILIVLALGAAFFFMNNQNTLTPGTSSTTTLGSPGEGNSADLQALLPQPSDDPILGDSVALKIASNARLGTYLVGFLGMTVYTSSKDTGSKSNCYKSCAIDWPPYIISTKDSITLGAGVAGKAGTSPRLDGTMQLTYNGKPLYFYPGDITQTDTKGNGIGGVWSVVKP